MSYQPLFDPQRGAALDLDQRSSRLGDRGRGLVYIFDEDPPTERRGRIRIAVDTALATGRPILVSGDPGTGKSSLAAAVAEVMRWRFYRFTVSSRTEARDLLWTFDAVRRLSDAQAGPEHLRPDAAYLEPGVLWWAFDPESATRRGMTEPEWKANEALEKKAPLRVPGAADPSPRKHERAVVLIDEIDKADPDVPNNLLEPLGSLEFRLPSGLNIRADKPPLVFITTNRERELPQAFLRRCLSLELTAPGPQRLQAIAKAHYPEIDSDVLQRVTTAFEEIRADHERRRIPKPGTAEFLDALGACLQLKLRAADSDWQTRWQEISDIALRKAPSRSPG